MADFSFSDDAELHKLSALVAENPDDFEHWNNLVQAAEAQENGINRNSSPNAITAMRETYDRFLARFPLFWAFWKRYADLEYKLAGTEAAELVYERGVASTVCSVDLWTGYCSFKIETSHDVDVTRELFDRGAESVGMDFMAHPFWDKYLEFEERSGEPHRLFEVLMRVVQIPLHQYTRFYERFRARAASRTLQELADPAIFAQLQIVVQQELGAASSDPNTFSQALRKKIDEQSWERFQRLGQEVNARWVFEQNIKRAYYHVTALEEDQLENWRNYLSFEEQSGDYNRTKTLYERCMVATANYEEFWFRYVRWMMGQGEKTEEIRNIFIRASCTFMKITQPAIRLAWAKWEEAEGRSSVAAEIHEAILLLLPDDLDTYKSWIQVQRRVGGLPSAEELLQKLVVNQGISLETRGALITEWARLRWQFTEDYTASVALFRTYRTPLAGSQLFWSGWLQFESDQPCQRGHEIALHNRVRQVHLAIQTTQDLSQGALKALASQYMMYLDTRGGKDAMKESVQLDAFVNGPDSIKSNADFMTLFNDQVLNGAAPRLKTIGQVQA